MNRKCFSESRVRRNGFYLALAVCLVAVGIAAWSTYDAVNVYISSSSQQESSESAAVSASSADDDDPEYAESSKREEKSENEESSSGSAQKRELSSAEESTVSESSAAKPESGTESETSYEADESSVGEDAQAVNAPVYERSSQMVMPLADAEIVKAYSAGAPVYSETMKDWRVHNGVDISAESGQDVFAAANGVVKETTSDAMLGNIVVIEHGDYVFYYCGVSESFKVNVGDVVTKGQVIANITAVPAEAADEPHLHLEVTRDGIYLNPEEVIAGTT